jgi:hypothetical protein
MLLLKSLVNFCVADRAQQLQMSGHAIGVPNYPFDKIKASGATATFAPDWSAPATIRADISRAFHAEWPDCAGLM